MPSAGGALRRWLQPAEPSAFPTSGAPPSLVVVAVGCAASRDGIRSTAPRPTGALPGYRATRGQKGRALQYGYAQGRVARTNGGRASCVAEQGDLAESVALTECRRVVPAGSRPRAASAPKFDDAGADGPLLPGSGERGAQPDVSLRLVAPCRPPALQLKRIEQRDLCRLAATVAYHRSTRTSS